MATNTLIMSYVLKKFKNARSSANNRWFALSTRLVRCRRVVSLST